MITADCHMHSRFSFDSEARLADMAETAIRNGLEAICITDHEDHGIPCDKPIVLEDPQDYVHTLHEFGKEYKDRLEIRTGIEIGLQMKEKEYYHDLIHALPFDFVIGSQHAVRGVDIYLGDYFGKCGDEEVYEMVFTEMAQCIRNIPDFDVVGHFDYAIRYSNDPSAFSYARYADLIDEALKAAAESGKGLELNTSGWAYQLEHCHPCPDILKRYREFGGEIITVGSDAHQADRIGYEFKRAEQVLLDCGFRYYTEFIGRKPVFKKLG